MNTMADGARDRLVAQIGEALFGQPGLTLMELAEKVKQHNLSLSQTIGERDRYHEVADDLAGHIAAITGVDIGEHSSANCPWQNAIEAAEEYRPAQPSPATCKDGLQVHPSPAGQDVLAELSAGWRARAEKHDENAREADSIGDMTATVQYLETKSEVLRQVAAELEAAIAARQPVGQPAMYQVRPRNFKDGEGWRKVTKREYDDRGPFPGYDETEWERRALYAAPDAQAVDLGAMPDGWRLSKRVNCYQLSHGNDIVGNLVGPDAEENAAIIARVLDSKAVGK